MEEFDLAFKIFSILALIFSVVAHEVSHGYMAQFLGDPTARLQGRLTLNPISHIDPIGSILVPIVTTLLPGGFVFGWAKPVPYNPYNLRDQKWGEAKVAASGPLTNLGIAVVLALVLHLGESVLSPDAQFLVATIVFINVILAVFNLVPIPPLDGSKVLMSVLPLRYRYVGEYLERYSLVLILFFAFFLWQFFMPIVHLIAGLLIGGYG
jgi:Zn-dependent protease